MRAGRDTGGHDPTGGDGQAAWTARSLCLVRKRVCLGREQALVSVAVEAPAQGRGDVGDQRRRGACSGFGIEFILKDEEDRQGVALSGSDDTGKAVGKFEEGIGRIQIEVVKVVGAETVGVFHLAALGREIPVRVDVAGAEFGK